MSSINPFNRYGNPIDLDFYDCKEQKPEVQNFLSMIPPSRSYSAPLPVEDSDEETPLCPLNEIPTPIPAVRYYVTSDGQLTTVNPDENYQTN